jgi:serine protease
METHQKTWITALAVSLASAVVLHAASTLQFAATAYTVAEDAGAVTLTVERLDDTNSVVSVDYATTNGTAAAGLKYKAVSGTLAFPAGVTNQAIVVPTLNEPFVEGTRGFQVTLSNPTGEAVLGGRMTATVLIKDNDTGLQIEYASYRVGEAAGPVVIGVVRGDDGDFPVTVEYATTDGTASAGQDYAATVGTLTFAVGERLKQLAIPIVNDALKEPTETFRLTLSNPSAGAVLGLRSRATITILDTTGMEPTGSTISPCWRTAAPSSRWVAGPQPLRSLL